MGTAVPYQDHVTGGDVHVGLDGLLTPGRGAAAGRGAGHGAIAELRGHAVDSRRVQRLRAVRGFHCHALAA